MRVRMVGQISGHRVDGDGNYSDWPTRGQEFDLDDREAVAMLRAGTVAPVSGTVEEAIASVKGIETSTVPVSLDSVPGPIDELAPEGVLVEKPNGELREISSTERLKPEDHAGQGVVTTDSGPVISPDPTSPSGNPETARKSSGRRSGK